MGAAALRFSRNAFWRQAAEQGGDIASRLPADG